MNKDSLDILRALDESSDECVLITLIGVCGSTYRKPGARLLVGQQGRLAGSVSGGCVERDLVRRAFWLTRFGPAVIRATADAENDQFEASVLGCGGTMKFFLERVSRKASQGAFCFLRWLENQRQPAVLATIVKSNLVDLEPGTRIAGHTSKNSSTRPETIPSRQPAKAP